MCDNKFLGYASLRAVVFINMSTTRSTTLLHVRVFLSLSPISISISDGRRAGVQTGLRATSGTGLKVGVSEE